MADDFQGFGGGSPDEQANNLAIPDDTQPPEWGQSLGQDVQNVGRAVGNAVRKPLQAVGDTLYGAGQAAAQGIGNAAPRIMSYLSGHGAMSQDQWDQLGATVDPHGTMDQNERTLRSIDTAFQHDPELGSAALQTARQHYDPYKANALKELSRGNYQVAAQDATMAHNYVPDGVKTVFAATKDGFTVGVWTPDGQEQKFNLSPNQMKILLQGEHGLFDHVTTHTAPKIIQAAMEAGAQQPQQPKAPNVASMQPGTEPTNEGVAPEPNARPGTGNVVGNIPQDYQTTDQALGRAPTPGRSLATGDRQPTYQDAGTHRNGVTRLPTPGEPDTDAMQEADQRSGPEPKVHWNKDQTRFEYDPQDVKTSPGGTKGPVRVIAGGVKPEDAANVPSASYIRGRGSILGPSENQRNAPRDVANARNQTLRDIAAERANASRDVAGTRAGATERSAQTRANATINAALIRAQTVASGNDTRYNAEQARTAQGILTSITKQGGTIDDALKQMQGKISPELIRHLTGQGEPERTGLAQPAQSVTPREGQTATNRQTGHRMIYQGGKWQDLR